MGTFAQELMLKPKGYCSFCLVLFKQTPMKKIIIACCFAAFSVTAFAQTTPAATPVSKEEKDRQKAQQEQDLTEAFKTVGLSEAQVTQVREALDLAGKASKELRANTALSEDQKVEAKKKINDDKNTRLKEIMGAGSYKKWNEVRRAQKARTTDAAPAGGR
jgi:hypothetical protein